MYEWGAWKARKFEIPSSNTFKLSSDRVKIIPVSNQNLRQIGQGVPALWLDIETERFLLYIQLNPKY